MKTWQGRFATPSTSRFESFTSSVNQDQVLAAYDLRMSTAHARALADAGVISLSEAETLVSGLHEIGVELQEGKLVWRDDLEDVHTHIEVRLREKLGDSGNKLHAGRSRNDQIAADLRAYVLDHTIASMRGVLKLQSALLELAERYKEALMPGYSHTQQAQPVLIAYPFLAHVAMLGRDWERFQDSLARTDRSPLGSGAVAGSTFPIDRELLAREAGLGAPIDNSLDAVGDRDFVAEFAFIAALCMTHLSRLAEDLILWSTTEFGFVHLPDDFASGSSMMPQKKNPDVLELIRGRCALVIGDVTAVLALLKGIPLGYDRDLQEDKQPLFHASQTLSSCLSVLCDMVPKLEFDTVRSEAAISTFCLATDLADHLVRHGVPFRDAHAAVGAVVGRFLETGRSLDGITTQDLTEAGARVDSVPRLNPRASVRLKATTGSTNPEDVERQRERELETLRAREAFVDARA